MNQLGIYCAIISGVVFLITLLCFGTNNYLYHMIIGTIDELTNKIKPDLILHHKPKEARFITVDELPMLQTWQHESQNYGVINIIGLLTSIALAVSVNLFHQLPYIIALGSMMFLGSNLMFYPRAYSRRHRVNKILINYRGLVKMLETIEIEKNKETINVNREQDPT